MHPLDIKESGRWGEPLPGLAPSRTLQDHALAAAQLAAEWQALAAAGVPLRTRTGDQRVLPTSLRRLARQYVDERMTPTASTTEQHFVCRYYPYAIEVELAALLRNGTLPDAWGRALHHIVSSDRPLKVLDRTLLNAVARHPGLDLRALVEQTGAPKETVRRHLTGLSDRGLLEVEERGVRHRYRLASSA